MNHNRSATAFITGASGGIGEAIAMELANCGIFTILVSRNADKIKAIYESFLAKENKGLFFQCDVTKPGEIERLTEQLLVMNKARLENNHLILINNAGYGGPFQRTDEMSVDEWDTTFNVNVRATFLSCKQLLPMMKENGWGRVINIASIYGSVGGALSSAYSASKHALVGYTKSISAEWAQHGITCNCISPGFIDTNMGAASSENYYQNVVSQIPVSRQGNPAEIAKLVSFLASDDSSYINGADIKIDGGLLSARSFR